jgi:hypothetical protein
MMQSPVDDSLVVFIGKYNTLSKSHKELLVFSVNTKIEFN